MNIKKLDLYTFVLFIILTFPANHLFAQSYTEIEFEADLENWQMEIKSLPPSSNLNGYMEIEAFSKIIDQGIRAVPHIINKIESDPTSVESICLRYGLKDITKMKYGYRELKNGKYDSLSFADKYMTWWNENLKNVESHFQKLYRDWSELPVEKKFNMGYTNDWEKRFKINKPTKEEAISNLEERKKAIEKWQSLPEGPKKERMRPYNRTVYQRLLDLGIAALPYAIEKIKQGDTDLIEAVNYWTDDALAKAAQEANISQEEMAEFVPQWWEENKENWLLPPVEQEKEE